MYLNKTLRRLLWFLFSCCVWPLRVDAWDVEFDDHRVMDQPIDGRGDGHGVLENLLPFRKRQIRTYQHAVPFVSFRQQCEQYFHLLAALLHIAQVDGDQGFEPVEFLGSEKVSDQKR